MSSARDVIAKFEADRFNERNHLQLDPPAFFQSADALLAALNAAGFVTVPKDPTDEMLHAGTMQVPTWDDEASRRKWRDMIDGAALNR